MVWQLLPFRIGAVMSALVTVTGAKLGSRCEKSVDLP